LSSRGWWRNSASQALIGAAVASLFLLTVDNKHALEVIIVVSAR
jgi:hypothetical protein